MTFKYIKKVFHTGTSRAVVIPAEFFAFDKNRSCKVVTLEVEEDKIVIKPKR